MASRLQQLLEKPTAPVSGGGSRLKFLTEEKPEGVIEVPEVPKTVREFPSTLEMLAELQIDPLSLKENPAEAIGAAWESLKGTVSESTSRIISQFTGKRTVGEQLKGIAAVGHLAFAPISALFEGANKIPVLGSVSKLISLPFIATGEVAPKISDKIVDELPIPDTKIELATGKVTNPKQEIKEGLGEIFALAAQIAVGKVTHVSVKKSRELRARFGEKDADTIVKKAEELAEQAKEPVPPEIVRAERGEPLRLKDIPPETKMGDVAEIARERGFEVPEFGKEVPEPKPKRTFVDVPREQLPVRVEGAEKGVSGLEARMKGVVETGVRAAKAEAEAKGLDISVYDKISKPEQLREAAKYVERTSQREALEVLKGEKPAPKGLLTNAIMLALEEKSLRDSNVDLAIKLASLRSTRMGQEISILTEVEGLSPVSGMDTIIRARAERAKKSLKEGETLQSKKSSVRSEAEKAERTTRLKLSEAEKLLSEIVCK